ncbi:MAG: hypothetical protein M0C28_40385 [Candidatus Moduliflexus flocculans]|nr:hypothetical protein [Candidatus Moduliflexus flocculans]
MLTQPAVSAERVAFVYANDLWTADLDGRDVRRLTSDLGGGDRSRPSRPTGGSSPSPASTTATSTSIVVPADGRRAQAADLASRRPTSSRASRPTARRSCSPRRAGVQHRRLLPALHRAGRGRRRRAKLPDPQRRPRPSSRPTARRIAYNPLPGGLHPVEELPRRHASRGSGSSTSTTHAVEKVPQPAGRSQRRRPDVGRRHGLLPVRPRRRVQPLRLRPGDQGRSRG